MNIEDKIIALLTKQPLSYVDLQRALKIRRDPMRSILADMKAAKMIFYNQTDGVLEIYRVAVL
jgi:hypothetical protein